MRPRRLLIALIALAAVADPVAAQEKVGRSPITIDDYFTQADIFQIALSPKLNAVAYTEGRWLQATDDRKSDLWIASTDGPARRLTADRANDRAPQWDADGRLIYFLGNRKREGDKRPPYDGKTQVWRIPASGGIPEAATRVDGGVDAFALARDGHSLHYVVHHEQVQDDWSGLRLKYKQLDYGHGLNQLGQVWKLDLQSWRAQADRRWPQYPRFRRGAGRQAHCDDHDA